MTHFPVTSLRSVDLETPDIATSEKFYTEVWGLERVAEQSGVIYLRAAGRDHHVLALHPGAEVRLRMVTFRIESEAAFATLAASASANGANVHGEVQANSGPDGGRVLSMTSPGGALLRLVHGDVQHDSELPPANRPTRLAHVNINSTDADGLAAFYERALGFRLTDRSKMMAFVRCNSDHHAVVIADASVNGLNHIAFQMDNLESVMRGSGRVVDAGYPIAWGVGRHGPGDNVFAYFIDPVGTVIEYTTEVLQVDDSYVLRGPSEWVWPPGRTDHWGIAPPKADHVKAAQLAVLFADA